MTGSIRKRGNTYSYSFDLGSVDGKRKRQEKGGFKTKKEAEQALRKAIQEYEQSGQVFKVSEITVADYMDYWIKEYVELNCKYNTIKKYESVIKNHIKPKLGKYKIKTLSPATLQQFVNDLYKDGYSKGTLNLICIVLSEALKTAVYPYQYINDNPMNYIKKPKYNTPKEDNAINVMTVDNFNKIIELYPYGSKYYIPLIIGYYTGCRIGEVLALTWDNINFNNKTMTIENNLIKHEQGLYTLGTPKTSSSSRTIFISDILVKILKQHKIYQTENKLKYGIHYINYYTDNTKTIYNIASNEFTPLNFICTYENGNLIKHSNISYCVKCIKNKLNIKFSFHTLRHTHATLLIENGADVKEVQKRLGHSSYNTTMNTYVHVTDEMQKKTVDIFDNSICRQEK